MARFGRRRPRFDPYAIDAGVVRGNFPVSVTAAVQRERSEAALERLGKARADLSPIVIAGRRIAETFWGRAWCSNLERYSDFASRLPRGRSYVRNRAVIDLQIARGKISALVQGSALYEVAIGVRAIDHRVWEAIVAECSGSIDSLVRLLEGALPEHVLEVVTRPGKGLFPSPAEIELRCSCPDWATMCKHVAAVLYGIGARLDHAPELLFALRDVDPALLVPAAATSFVAAASSASAPGAARRLEGVDLSEIFGIAIEDVPLVEEAGAPQKKRKAKKR